MTNDLLTTFSNQLADAVDAAAVSVVQVQGRGRPASGLVYADGVVLTTVRALGRSDDGLRVRRHDGATLEAELAGWDPTTRLAVLRVPGLDTAAIAPAAAPARVGHLALAVARSWSNAVTGSAGIVSVIGGPLPTGRRRSIDQVIRTTAPMHDGFAGGAFLDTWHRRRGRVRVRACRQPVRRRVDSGEAGRGEPHGRRAAAVRQGHRAVIRTARKGDAPRLLKSAA